MNEDYHYDIDDALEQAFELVTTIEYCEVYIYDNETNKVIKMLEEVTGD
jgi:hypothetical protein